MKNTKIQRLTKLVVAYIEKFGSGRPHFNDPYYIADLQVRKPLPVCSYDDSSTIHEPPDIYLTAAGKIVITTDGSGPTGECAIFITAQQMRECIRRGKPYPW